MFRLIFLIILLIPTYLHSQNNYNNHWLFGKGHHVNFNNNIIQNGGIPDCPIDNEYYLLNYSYGYYATVSYPISGDLAFFIFINRVIPGNANYYKNIFYNKLGLPMPNGNVYISSYVEYNHNPIIVPHPSDTSKYYVFTCLDRGLQYSIVNMQLNNGLGDIEANFKLVPLLPANSVFGGKVTVVPSCNANYLIVRRTDTVAFNSFRIDAKGIDINPIYSSSSILPQIKYTHEKNLYNRIIASSNGALLAETFIDGGLILYDIRPCDGAIINERLIDTVDALSVGFSPDNKLLYSTRKEYQTGNFESSEIVQWDVSNPQDVDQIKQSAYVVLINSAHQYPNVDKQSAYMGDLRIGKDQKMYVAANLHYLNSLNPYPVFPSITVPDSQVMHIIHQPNVKGVGCQVERDGFPIKGVRQNRAYYWLPHPIYEVPQQLPDTIYNSVDSFYNCFNRGIQLSVPPTATCIYWYNGQEASSLHTKDTGLLWVRYAIDCQWYVDSFYSFYVPAPYVPQQILGCENNGVIQVQHPPSALTYHYTLVNEAYGWERKGYTTAQDSFWKIDYLPSGAYSLHLRAGQCDTTIPINIAVFPKASLTIATAQDTLWAGQSTFLEASGAYLYTWFPHLGLDTTMGSKVLARPPYTMQYEVIGINDYGCRDTAYIQLIVQDSQYVWLPNAFSPNHDGLNDALGLIMSPNIKLLRWEIYNRWGQLVFFTQDATSKWDGSYKGQTADMGVYYYFIEYVHQNRGQVAHKKGEVHLIR